MTTRDNLQNISALLAQVAGNPLLWEHVLLRLAEQLQCDNCVLLVTDMVEREKTRFLYCANISADYREKYEQNLNRLDIFNYFISKNPRHVFCNQNLPKSYQYEVETHAKQHGKRNYRIGFAIPWNHHYSLNVILARETPFSETEQENYCQLLLPLLPKLEQAIFAEQQQKIQSQLLLFLDDHCDGYLIVDSQLQVIYKDPVYVSYISNLPGIMIYNNQLNLSSLELQHKLQQLVLNHEDKIALNDHVSHCRINVISIQTLENLYHWECYNNAHIIAFTRLNNSNPALERLTLIYELSHCEAECALQFMHNPSIPELALNSYRSKATVRNHLKHIMHKMDVHNQAALMKKLLSLNSLNS